MSYKEMFKEENESICERYELAVDRIRQIPIDNEINEESIKTFFTKVASFIIEIKDNFIEDGTIDELKAYNHLLYKDIENDNYKCSYANPEYMYKCLIDDFEDDIARKYTKVLSFLYTELRACIVYLYEYRLVDMTVLLELFIEVYNLFIEDDIDIYKAVKTAMYYYISDYSDEMTRYRTREILDKDLDFATNIIMKSDLTDLRYLYKYGEYISDNEIKIAEYFNSMTEDKVREMARTFTEGYRLGFINNNIDLSKKSTVNIRYHIGFERMIKYAIEQFREMNLEPIIYRNPVIARFRKNSKIGYYSTSPNNQYDYDHRYDKAIFFDKALSDKWLVNIRMAYKQYADLADVYAGPAVLEVFGEKPFAPKSCGYAATLNEKQEKLVVHHNMESNIISNEFMKRDTISFTIIAYPIPDIGEKFDEIFKETVKVNTLDMDLYREIQQKIIDALDKGDYVHVKGCNGNKTDIKVNLYELSNPEKETIFENCLADVNIPVGEVFTSPKLQGTNGVLYVSEVYLNELKYIGLEIVFEDGKIVDYNCKNFEDEEKNKRFIKENIMFNHDTLPIGEFAIGTNTTAYVMGKNFDIADKLPILIAEKTGPHFAVGDTCYSMSEDTKLYNPDGKEIVAKENEISILRKTDMSKAYFNCHTDITIPYNELGLITVCTKSGDKIDIIKNGRFVLDGTTKLNEAFDNLNK